MTATTSFLQGATQTLYARWTEHTYTITYTKNATDAQIDKTSENFTILTSITMATTTRTGYQMSGWLVTSNGGNWGVVNSQKYSNGQSGIKGMYGNVTLTAQWTANTYTIAFNANAGTGTMNSVTARYGQTVTLPANTYTRTGYSFTGWAKSAGGTKVYNDSAQVSNLSSSNNATVTLYACWTAKTYTLVFDSNGGSAVASVSGKVYDTTYGTLPSPTRAGYDFQGWFNTETSNNGSGTLVRSDSRFNTTTATLANVPLVTTLTCNQTETLVPLANLSNVHVTL